MEQKKLTAQIAAAYFGSEAIILGTKSVGKIFNIGLIFLRTEDNNFGLRKVLISDCQLLLSPLSAISDEHAVEVLKVINSDPSHTLIRNPHAFLHQSTMHYLEATKFIDKLRELGYDCGYGSIPSLIEAGIALDKTTLVGGNGGSDGA